MADQSPFVRLVHAGADAGHAANYRGAGVGPQDCTPRCSASCSCGWRQMVWGWDDGKRAITEHLTTEASVTVPYSEAGDDRG